MPKEYYFWKNKYTEGEIRNFIKKYPERCDHQDFWFSVSRYQKLSENFIREFQDKVNWEWVSEDQDLSEKFLIEFIDKISNYYLEMNEKIPKKVKGRIINLKKVRNA